MKLSNKPSLQWLTFGALVLKFVVGAGVVFGPRFILAPSDFGDYVKYFSLVVVVGYVIDFGLSIKSLTIPRADTKEIKFVFKFVIFRDFCLFVFLGCLFFFLSYKWFLIAVASLFGANIVSMQSIARAAGDYLTEFAYNLAPFVTLAAVLGYLLWVGGAVSPIDAILGFVVLPRVSGLLVTFFYIYFRRDFLSRVESPCDQAKVHLVRRLQGFLKLLFPYALQGVVVAGASNFDVLAASFVMSSTHVGEIKLVTTAVGLFLVLPEISANYSINRLVNAGASGGLNRNYWAAFRTASAVLFVLSLMFFYFSRRFLPVFGADIFYLIAFSLVVALRVQSLATATYLTATKRQSSRVSVMMIANLIYWGLVYVLGSAFDYVGFVLAFLLSAMVQTVAYSLTAKKYV